MFAVARYATDGSLDSAFDGDGKVTTIVASDDEARGMAIQRDGKIVAVGLACNLCIAGPDFGAGTIDHANAVSIQTDGKIVVAGFSQGDFALARYKVCRVSSRRSSIPCR